MSTKDGIDYGAAYFYGADAYQGPGTARPTSARRFYEEGYGNAAVKLVGVLTRPRPLAIEGEAVPYLKGLVTALRATMEAAEAALLKAELAQDRAVSIREEYEG